MESSILGGCYKILKKIGSGGDGIVYLTRHIPTGQLRAAKGFRPEAYGSRLRELQVLRMLHHPSLPQIFDIFEESEKCWLIMEYVDGESLSRINRREIRADCFFDIAIQLVEILMYLHTRNPPVLHLDIKPTNLLLDGKGRLVLIDFGASVWQRTGMQENPCTGTPGFAAPEQMDRAASVDVRTDIYGCGAVLQWYLCGQRAELTGGKWKEQSRNLHGWRKSAYRIVQKCVMLEKERRYSDTLELLHALKKAEKQSRCRRQMRHAAGAGAILLITILFAVFALKDEMHRNILTEQQMYEQQLRMAEGLGLEQAAVCYETAAQLCPDEFSWCMTLLERITSDYHFELEEETILKKLLYSANAGRNTTNMEALMTDTRLYGQFAYQMGLAYWYFYEQAGGRSAAARWFERAVDSLQTDLDNQSAEWYESALLHAKIAGYYDRVGREDENGALQVSYAVYWADLYSLWNLKGFAGEPLLIRRQVAEELLAGMILKASELKKSAVDAAELCQLIHSFREFATDMEEEGEWLDQCDEAEAAVKRVYQSEDAPVHEISSKSN